MIFTRSVLGASVVAGMLAPGGKTFAADDGVVCIRDGLANFPKHLPPTPSGGNRVRLCYIGGGSIQGTGASDEKKAYATKLTGRFRRAFPGRQFVEVKKGLRLTGSWLTAFRTETEVLRHYMALKLVVLDSAADDYGMPEARVKAAVEGIVRQIREKHPFAEILFVYSLRKEFLADFSNGMTPDVIQWHEQVAAHYGIPSVNMAKFVADKISAGELAFAEFSTDGLHPTDRGHKLYAEAVQPLIDQCKAAEPPAELVAHELPVPLTPRPLVAARLVTYERGDLQEGWLGWQESPVELFFHVVRCNEPGPVLSMRFKGAAIGYFDVLGPDSGDLEFSIDGGPWQFKQNFDEFAKVGFRPHAGLLAENLDPEKEHKVRIRVAAKQPAVSKGRWARIAEFLIDGRVVFDEHNRGKGTLERIDALWAEMEPVKYVSPADSLDFLPNTIRLLQEGPTLRIVMLGDSIVNDTAHSQY